MTLQEFELALEGAYQEIVQPACPGPASETIEGFSRYQNTVASLPNKEQAKLQKIASLIVRSARPGCPPIVTVQLTGHADFDPQREQREPGYMHKISLERALAVKRALSRLINNTAISSRVVWHARGAGASQLLVPAPRTEEGRRRNRRVEIVATTGASRLKPYVQVRNNRFVGNVAVLGRPLSGRMTTVSAFQPLARPSIAQVPLTIFNIREDVLNAMDRLHLLWSITNGDYNAEYPTVFRLPAGSIVDYRRIPLTVAAITRNNEPTLHNQVAKYFLNQPLSQPIGRGLPNVTTDVAMVQDSLRALGLLSDPNYSIERANVSHFAAVSSPDVVMPKTLQALTDLKEKIAGFRLGWRPLQADESEAGGDRYGGRTFDFTVTTRGFIPFLTERDMDHSVSIFIPRGVTPDTNNVHVFFSPRGAAEDRIDNDVLVQGLRGAADSTSWIVIGVSGINIIRGGRSFDGWRTIDDAAIKACLTRAGRPPNITTVRLSGHSRGVLGLTQTLNRSLVSPRIDRIVILDAPELFARRGGSNVIVYRVNVKNKTVPGAIQHDLDPECVRAVGYSRLIKDAMVTEPLLSIPAAIRSQLLPIPDRGCFSTAPARKLSGCQVGFQDFCQRNRTLISSIIRQERGPNGLHTFVEHNNLLRAGHPISPGIYSHHIFVAEIAHEITNS